MKTVVYRGGVLRFCVPSSWKEKYSDWDGGVFYEDVPGSGTLRIKVITLRVPTKTKDNSAAAIMEPILRQLGKDATDVVQVGRNALVRYQQASIEQGKNLRIFYWVFANPVPPSDARVVTFSYTVLETEANTTHTLDELNMLEREIVKTEFAAQIGVVSE
jgi:hypothetical protein